MEVVAVTMRFKKRTKNTVVYEAEEGQPAPPAITVLYIQKWALPNPPPEFIAVTVREVN